MLPVFTLTVDLNFKYQKIRPFSNLNGAKIAKNGLTIIFGINFERFRSTRKYNNILRKNAFDPIIYYA